jgi:hypothetical protein
MDVLMLRMVDGQFIDGLKQVSFRAVDWPSVYWDIPHYRH